MGRPRFESQLCHLGGKHLTYKKDKRGNIIEDEFNIDPHTFSAIWYALDGYEVTDLKQFNRTKYGI